MPPPTVPPPGTHTLSSALKRNIRTLEDRRKEEAESSTLEERIAQAITSFTGSMRFVYLHLAVYAVWISINVGLIPGLPKFDPSFVLLAMEASVEAIFLSTFVLISQNRMSAAADKRADLDLHINLLAEHELTKMAEMVATIAERLQISTSADPELQEITRDVAPEAVLDEIEATQKSDTE